MILYYFTIYLLSINLLGFSHTKKQLHVITFFYSQIKRPGVIVLAHLFFKKKGAVALRKNDTIYNIFSQKSDYILYPFSFMRQPHSL